MVLYRYIKAPPTRIHTTRRPMTLSLFFITSGVLILLWVTWPIVSFTVLREGLLQKVISPIEDQAHADSSTVLSPVVLTAVSGQTNVTELDYTNANMWFPTAPQRRVVTPVNSYKLSIPKLKIIDATVIIAGDDLKKSLIHYGGTALPGEYGNSVIFGHSTLPQFFSPTNYTSIFSTVPTLKVGDEIRIAYDGITYRYLIYEMTVTDPGDLSALAQRFDDSYITLITCVPPGTYWKRLDVHAKLSRLSS